MYDLPTISKKEKSNSKKFRTTLLKNGFIMFQYSIYVRYCFGEENANMHRKRLIKLLIDGKISIIKLTDNQFKSIQMFEKRKKFVSTNTPELLTFY
jgi:CRISPR-associated protein Cas2